MNDSAHRENNRTLADLLGSSEDEAAALLTAHAAITVEPSDTQGGVVAEHVQLILARTLARVTINDLAGSTVAVEIVVGSAVPRHAAPRVFVSILGTRIVIGAQPGPSQGAAAQPITLLLASCYTCAAAMSRVVGPSLPYPVPEAYDVDLGKLLGTDLSLMNREVDFDEAVLAGAGAIGNGFVLGLSCLPVRGKLTIADDDKASAGNLQRCVLFQDGSIKWPKAEELCRAGEARLGAEVQFRPFNDIVQKLPERRPGPWLKRLIVAVDSPRARRQLQGEYPGEVFDASTTGASEIVLHFHRQPTDGACMACVYPHSPEEHAREIHIADTLGVTLGEVREMRVSPASAAKIHARYPHLTAAGIEGQAYDTLFKALCSSDRLMRPEGRQVLTPFAFVSVLAGAMLALEFFRRIAGGHNGLYNEWRISPWTNPVMRRQRFLNRHPTCPCCSNPILRELAAGMWTEKAPSQVA